MTAVKHCRYRPVAYRIAFLDDVNFENSDFTVSHLCHNPGCMNPSHHVFETLEVNIGRRGCAGGSHCHHKTTCIRPGPTYAS